MKLNILLHKLFIIYHLNKKMFQKKKTKQLLILISLLSISISKTQISVITPKKFEDKLKNISKITI